MCSAVLCCAVLKGFMISKGNRQKRCALFRSTTCRIHYRSSCRPPSTPMAESYPSSADLSPPEWKTCHVEGCGTKFKQFKYLIQHLIRSHGFDKEWVQSSWVHLEYKRERCTPPTEAVTAEEAAFVNAVVDEHGNVVEPDYICLRCGDGRVLRKRSFETHMMRFHSVRRAVSLCRRQAGCCLMCQGSDLQICVE